MKVDRYTVLGGAWGLAVGFGVRHWVTARRALQYSTVVGCGLAGASIPMLVASVRRPQSSGNGAERHARLCQNLTEVTRLSCRGQEVVVCVRHVATCLTGESRDDSTAVLDRLEAIAEGDADDDLSWLHEAIGLEANASTRQVIEKLGLVPEVTTLEQCRAWAQAMYDNQDDDLSAITGLLANGGNGRWVPFDVKRRALAWYFLENTNPNMCWFVHTRYALCTRLGREATNEQNVLPLGNEELVTVSAAILADLESLQAGPDCNAKGSQLFMELWLSRPHDPGFSSVSYQQLGEGYKQKDNKKFIAVFREGRRSCTTLIDIIKTAGSPLYAMGTGRED